jgi:protocatechuate 3,4-dioxygenase beta subunit
MKSYLSLFKGESFARANSYRLLNLVTLFLVLLSYESYATCTTCNNNLVVNPGFDSNVNSWSQFNGNFYRSTSFPQCGTSGHAEYQNTSSSWGGFFQDINLGTGGLTNGSLVQLTFWAGVHDANANSLFGIEYFNGTTYHSETTIQIDKILGGSPSMQYYSINSVVPAGVNKLRIIGKVNWGYIKVDEICLNIATCNPDNASAPPFCAPTPVCSNGNFLWSQSINPSDGGAGIRLFCGGTKTYTIPGPYPTSFASGALTLNISDAVSYDGYNGRNTVTQPNERWRLVFRKSGSTVATSNWTTDVPDQKTQAYWRGSLGSVVVPNGVDQIIIEHWSQTQDCNSPNSVVPVSVCISATPQNPCVNFAALAQSNTNLIKTRNVTNEVTCGTSPVNRVFYADCLSNNDSDFYKIVSGGEFKEYCDGTASLEMVVESTSNTNQRFSVHVVYTGRTFTAPAGSPHIEGCTTSASSNWYYYTSMRGTLIGLNDFAGAVISFREKMSSFQLGSNASLYQSNNGQFGASGWLDYTIINQPTNTTFNAGCQLDFNFYLSGGDLTPAQASACNVSCPGQSVNLTALTGGGKPNYTYNWSNGLGAGQNKTVNPSTTTTYTVTITDANNCSATDQVTVNVNPQLNLVIPNDEVCAGSNYTKTVQATGGTPGYMYAWSGGLGSGNQKSIPAQNATYTVTVTDSKGCTAVGSFTVTVTTLTGSASNDGPLTCTKTSVTLTANPSGMSYAWSGGGNTRTKVVSTTGTYTVTITDSNGCTAVATTTVTGDTSVPSASASNDGPLTCVKTSVTLTANPATGVTYSWSGGGTNRTKAVTTAGTYTVTVTNLSNNCTAVATTTVTGDTSVPSASASNDGPLTCVKTSVTLTANPATGVTYSWSGGGTNRTKAVTTTGTYTVTVTNTSNGCTAVASTIVTGDTSVPSASASNNGPLTCAKSSVTLTANPATGVTYSWSGGGTNRTKAVASSGTYTVTVTNISNGCTAVATTTVTQDVTVPNASADNIGGPLTCVTNSVTIRAFPNDASLSYSWSGPAGYAATSRTNIVSTPGSYAVTVTNPTNGCSATASTTVSQDISNPTASATNDGPITCAKTSVILTANPATGVTYAWSGGGSLRTKTVTTAGTYTVTVTSTTNGCTAVATTTVTGDTSVPSASAGNDGPLTCIKTSVILTANPATGVTYLWSGGGTNRTKTVTTAGTYTVTVTSNSNGCTALATTTVAENTITPNASADNIGGPLTCIDNSVTIRAFPNIATYTYTWSGPGGYTATSRTNNVSVAGNYTVTVTDSQNGCTASSSTAVLQDVSIPTANAGPDKTICNGTNTTLTATGNGSYRWSTAATTASITVNPTTTTTYTVTVTGANGCTASDAVVVTVTPLPSSGLTGPNEICVDEYAVFNASPVVSGATYSWTFDGGTSLDGDANDPTESIKWASTFQNTTRTVTLTVSKDNCSNTYTKAILVKTGVFLNTQDNYPVCQGGTVQIGPNPNDANQVSPGATFQWTPNLFLNSNTVARPLSTPPFDITYTLTATLNGCAISRQITVDVNVNLNPVADAGQDKTVCLGNNVQIGGTPTATPPAGATISGVIWTVPPSSTITSTVQNPLVSPTTNTQYRVVVVSSTGCTDTDFVNVTVQPKARIGNFVWRDDNANGVQDTNEPGLGSVPVKLYNTSNVEVAQTTTNAQGLYEFEVCAGTYYVEFAPVTGYSRTIANTSDDTKDSDANVTNGRTQNYTLNPGDNNPTVDAGYIPNGKIGDFVWEDRNGNGQQDAGESGISGVTVQLLDQNNNVIRTTTTSSTGAYEFDNLPPGTYFVRVTPPSGYSSTTPNSGNDNTDSDINSGTNTTGAINLGAGETNLTIDAGLLRSASLGDFVFEDRNGNGVQDAGEPGISGVTVSLEDASGNPARDINNNIITATTTGTNGQYQFTNLKSGIEYVVKFNTPSGYQPTSTDRGGDDTRDSDANVTTGKASGVTLESGQNNPTIDAGYYRLASIGDFVWDDTNGNGRQDAGEPGVSGLTVTLTGTSGDGMPVSQTTTTGPDGSYSFTGLKPGTYTVTFTKPAGTAYTGQDTGTDDKDSDASPTTGSTTAITLISGQNNTTIDAGVLRPASLGDYVFEDRNGNGVQDVGEPGISGVTVSLEDASGNPARDINNNIITATTTGTNGQYQFTNLKPGVVYVVKFNTPSGYQPTSADRGGDDTKDSDANITTGKASGVTLTGGQNNPTIDAGYYRPATIGDFVWEDKNGNGVQDSGEPGIAGVTVTLTGIKGDGTPIAPITVTTGTTGSYQFTNLAPGTYTVTFTKPANTVTTTPDQGGDDTKDSDASITTGASAPVTVQSGETNNTIDAGYLKSASLGDFVWEDRNANGVQDAGEPGIAGVTVRLEDAAGNQARDINNALVANATTGTNGQYQFTNLRPGVVYVVNFIAPNGFTTTTKDSGSDDTKDSDASITTGKSQQVTLSSGENNPTIDAGYYRRASIGDFVWEDLNANGIQDAGEPGIGGVTVRLFNSSGVQEAFTVTAANGSYSFNNLIPGSYTVRFDTPNSYTPTPRDLGGDDTKDSDANPVNGLTPVVNLAGGDNVTTIDAGYYRLAQIGNFVWEDRNANGVQDAFEPGIAGVTVTLSGTDAFGTPVIRTTTTDASGLYQFTNLVPGNYTVTFTKPGEIYKASPRDAGSDDARDSDANTTTGASPSIALKSGDNNQTIDAGFYRCAYVGDYVWLDNNNNDLQDASDIGLNGILVELYRVGNPVPVQTMLTTNDPRTGREGRRGYYMFEVCDLGDYTIKVKPDMNIYHYVQPNQGIDDAIDSDIIDFINQSTLIFTVSYAAQITDIDAGVKLRPLPVTLKSFTGWWNTKKDVNELEWATVSETNNDYFEVERSFRGSDFEVVAKVSGAGNSTTTQTYAAADTDILVNGVYTYRLKQVDYDGKATYHGPIEVKVERSLEGGNIKVYPNPSRGAFSIDIEVSEGQSIKADLFDNTGKLIRSEMIDKVSQGELIRYQNDTMNLDKGMYYIVINIDGVITSKPLIIIE